MSLYQIKERLFEVRPKPGSVLIGRALADTGIGDQLGLTVIAIERNSHFLLAPAANTVIHKHDILLIEGRQEVACKLIEWGTQVEPIARWPANMTSKDVELLEVLVAPRSRAIGQTLRQSHSALNTA